MKPLGHSRPVTGLLYVLPVCTKNQIAILHYILINMALDNKGIDKIFWIEWQQELIEFNLHLISSYKPTEFWFVGIVLNMYMKLVTFQQALLKYK